MTDSETLARAWVSLQENWWAHDELDDASVDDPELAWSAICRVLEAGPTQEVLEVTAAGPLQPLIRAHATAFIDRIEVAARTHESWRQALRIVRIPPSDDDVSRRLFALGCARVISVQGLPDGFIGDVRAYVQLIDSSDSLQARQLLAHAAELLCRIYSASIRIGATSPVNDEIRPNRPSPLERLSTQLGSRDLYFCVFNARVYDEPVGGSLADDLADIYLELSSSLDDFDAGQHDDAVWGWRFALRGHAGDHLSRALPAIHAILKEEQP
jgi:hypothetical protein